MALAPPPFSDTEFSLHWRKWLSTLDQFVNPAANSGNDDSTPVIVDDPEYTVGDWPVILLCDTKLAGGDITIQMPEAILAKKIYHVKKLNNLGNVIVKGLNSETIDQGVIATIQLENESMMIVSDKDKWYVI